MSFISMSKLHSYDSKLFFESFDTVIAICDGVLWLDDDNACPKAAEVMNVFKNLDKQMLYMSNNSSFTKQELLEKCENFFIDVDENEILCTSNLAASYLRKLNINGKIYIIGSSKLREEVEMEVPHCDILHNSESITTESDSEVKAVVVGFDDKFNLNKAKVATHYLKQPNTIFIGTNSDKKFLMDDIVVPGTGCIISCIEACSKKKAVIMGKPDLYLFDYIRENYDVNPARTLLICGDLKTDVLFGRRCGFKTLLMHSNIMKIIRNLPPVRDENDLIPDYIDTWDNLHSKLIYYVNEQVNT